MLLVELVRVSWRENNEAAIALAVSPSNPPIADRDEVEGAQLELLCTLHELNALVVLAVQLVAIATRENLVLAIALSVAPYHH